MQAMYEMFYVDALIDVVIAMSIPMGGLFMLSLILWMIDWSRGLTASNRNGDPEEF